MRPEGTTDILQTFCISLDRSLGSQDMRELSVATHCGPRLVTVSSAVPSVSAGQVEADGG